ncbi:hypothetical protein EI94DRAFT_1703021 [Lactarius quietus]|nr:hypothetical protein EI94DRAFT_1703021 [Lactarius quietus]
MTRIQITISGPILLAKAMQGTASRLLILIGISRNLLYITAPVLEGGVNCIQCTHLTFLVSLTVPTPTVFENGRHRANGDRLIEWARMRHSLKTHQPCIPGPVPLQRQAWVPHQLHLLNPDECVWSLQLTGKLQLCSSYHPDLVAIAAGIVFVLILFGIFCQDFEQLLEGRDTL